MDTNLRIFPHLPGQERVGVSGKDSYICDRFVIRWLFNYGEKRCEIKFQILPLSSFFILIPKSLKKFIVSSKPNRENAKNKYLPLFLFWQHDSGVRNIICQIEPAAAGQLQFFS